MGQKMSSLQLSGTYLPFMSEANSLVPGGIQRTSPGTPSVSCRGYEKFFQSTFRIDCGAAPETTAQQMRISSSRISFPRLSLATLLGAPVPFSMGVLVVKGGGSNPPSHY